MLALKILLSKEVNVNKIAEATKYLDQDIAVIPIKTNSKIAAIPWKKYQKCLPNKADITRWFSGTDYNMAIICGNGLVVLDFDDLRVYEKWHLKHSNINTRQVRTKRGYHLYFRMKNAVETKIKPVNGIDIKANGYVLVPPSIVGSHRYEVVNGTGIMEVDDLSEVVLGIKAMGTPIRCNGSITSPDISVPVLNHRLYHGVIADIKTHLSVLDLASQYTDMEQTGLDAYMGLCPHSTHADSKPSFRVVAGRANCFKQDCALHDPRALDVIELYGRIHSLSGREAIFALARELRLVQ